MLPQKAGQRGAGSDGTKNVANPLGNGPTLTTIPSVFPVARSLRDSDAETIPPGTALRITMDLTRETVRK